MEKERIKEQADIERIAREIHILKKLRHPHVIQLYDVIFSLSNFSKNVSLYIILGARNRPRITFDHGIRPWG
jgi:serine/threonine protein kinase